MLDSVSRIERATQRMGGLIDDLLHLSRVGRVRNEFVDVDVTALVCNLADEFRGRIEESGVELQIEENLPRVRADERRLLEVFDNLLTNALKYGATSPVPEIAIGGTVVAGAVRYFVRDNGPGIPEQYHRKIFGLFQRLETRQEGTGVGLAIVARIMEVHNGRVWVESAPGRGATFWIEFPSSSTILSGADGQPVASV